MISYEEVKHLVEYSPETGEFFYIKNGKRRKAQTDNTESYHMLHIKGKSVPAHRVAWILMTKTALLKGQIIDHKNRIRSDNKWNNLRLVDHMHNMHNKAKASWQEYKGIRAVRRKGGTTRYNGAIVVNGFKDVWGDFITKEQAAKSYDRKNLQFCGEYALAGLNFPLETYNEDFDMSWFPLLKDFYMVDTKEYYEKHPKPLLEALEHLYTRYSKTKWALLYVKLNEAGHRIRDSYKFYIDAKHLNTPEAQGEKIAIVSTDCSVSFVALPFKV